MTALLTHRRVALWLALVTLGLCALVLTGCDEDSIERSIGSQTSTAVEKEYGVNRDPVLNEWLDTMGHTLVGQSGRQNIPYSFKVCNTDMVNAFAAPYGYIYVTRGMLGFAQSEDELAFVVAHEVGHVTYRHSIKSMKQSLWFNIGAALVGNKSEGLGTLAGLGAGLMMLHYSRGDEQEADVAGVVFGFGAGYDPCGGPIFFQRLMDDLEKDRPSRFETLFLTHPASASRLSAANARPELSLKDPAVASRIGRSYSRRYAYAAATKYYNMAIAQKPEAVTTRIYLGDAYAGQGLYDQAKQQYQAALEKDGANPYATWGLSAVNDTSNRPRYVSLPAGEVQLAQGSLSQVSATEYRLNSLGADVRSFSSTGAKKLNVVSGVAKQSISSMLDISSENTQLTDKGQQAYILANGAVSAANEAAFTQEALSKDVLRLTDSLRAQTSRVRNGLQLAAGGRGQAGDVVIYLRALQEVGNAAAQLDLALANAQQNTALVEKALASGTDTMTSLTTMLAAKEPDKYVFFVTNNAEDTRGRAEYALAAVNKAKRLSTEAEARSLLARINLASLGAGPEVRRSYDGLVARFCSTQPAVVSQLRGRGLGYGDAAFALMGARAANSATNAFVPAASGQGVIDDLVDRRLSLEGPVILLRFVALALEREAAARNQ